MPKNPHVKKVVVIGSGPIVIGQAAEFDYAGTQACRSLREEGICVVLINSNPATIMTDKDIADKVYRASDTGGCKGSYQEGKTGQCASDTGWTGSVKYRDGTGRVRFPEGT